MEDKINNKEYFLAKWLEGKLTDHELKQLVSSNDYQFYLNLRRGISNFELLEQPLNSSLKKIKNRIFNKRKATTNKINYKWALSIAASLAIIFGLFFLIPSTEISHSTVFGQQKVIELPDGSLVTINSKSTIEFNPDSWQ